MDFQKFCSTFNDKVGTKHCKEHILPPSKETINYP